jgi:hypothetical protein
MAIEIRNRWTGATIFTHDVEGATMRDAVLAARAADSNLRGSDLSGSDLSGSDLSGSDLSGSDLRGSDLSGSDLSGSDLSGSDLSGSDLSGSDLSGSDLSDSDLSGSNLSGSDLSGSNLTPIRDDIWAVLSSMPLEVPALIEALKSGRVDGSTYSGECSCLVGTLAKACGASVDNLALLKPNSSRPAERFFMGIRKGDTPETSQFSALALEWSQYWLNTMRAAFAPTVPSTPA